MGPKKRNRRSYNCGPCKKHKIKCDMKTPCGNCSKYGREVLCLEEPPNPPTKEQLYLKGERRRKYLQKKASKLINQYNSTKNLQEDSTANSNNDNNNDNYNGNNVQNNNELKFKYEGASIIDGYLNANTGNNSSNNSSNDNFKLPSITNYQYLPFQMQGQTPISHIMYQQQFIPQQQQQQQQPLQYQPTTFTDNMTVPPSNNPGQIIINENMNPNSNGNGNTEIKWNLPTYQMPPPSSTGPSSSMLIPTIMNHHQNIIHHQHNPHHHHLLPPGHFPQQQPQQQQFPHYQDNEPVHGYYHGNQIDGADQQQYSSSYPMYNQTHHRRLQQLNIYQYNCHLINRILHPLNYHHFNHKFNHRQQCHYHQQ